MEKGWGARAKGGVADWDTFAKSLGYGNEFEMFYNLYVEERLSFQDIANALTVSTTRVAKKLQEFGIPTRPRGGANNKGTQRIRLHKMDQRIVFFLPHQEVIKLTSVSHWTLTTYKKSIIGESDGLLHNSTDSGAEPIFDSVTKTLGAATGKGS